MRMILRQSSIHSSISGSRILGTFELIHESGAKIFTYAKIDIRRCVSSLKYNYMNDTVKAFRFFSTRPPYTYE
jgi:hypothetical protein